MPGTIAIAVLTVGISRLLNFQPGYVYGLLAVFAYRRGLDPKRQGRLTAINCVFVLGLTLAAWVARVPVSSAASGLDPSVFIIMLEVLLGGIFLLGLESLLIDLLPIRFLDGKRIIRWSRAAWAALFGNGLFVLVHVLRRPGNGYVGKSETIPFIVVAVLFGGFGAFSVAFLAYFRFRPARS